jgi:hypothetical protein
LEYHNGKSSDTTLHCSANTVITNPINKLNVITLNETISFTFITYCCYSCEAGRKPHRRSKFILLNRLPQPVSHQYCWTLQAVSFGYVISVKCCAELVQIGGIILPQWLCLGIKSKKRG